jgi:hypothetical protein
MCFTACVWVDKELINLSPHNQLSQTGFNQKQIVLN